MSERRKWKGTSQRPRTEEEHREKQEWEALPPEEKKAAQRKQLLAWLEMFKGKEAIVNWNGKPQPHNPMSQEEADLHLALFDNEIGPTEDVKIEFAQFLVLRTPESQRILYRYWKLQFPNLFNNEGKTK
mgnify:CR=1 FL=1